MSWAALALSALSVISGPAQASAPAVRMGGPPPVMVINNVVRGGQAEIDAGKVVLIAGCFPGGGCGTWLAGHHTTHGSVFAQVADLIPNEVVWVMGHHYVVYEHDIVCCWGEVTPTSADLTLQTSAEDRQVHLVLAREIRS